MALSPVTIPMPAGSSVKDTILDPPPNRKERIFRVLNSHGLEESRVARRMTARSTRTSDRDINVAAFIETFMNKYIYIGVPAGTVVVTGGFLTLGYLVDTIDSLPIWGGAGLLIGGVVGGCAGYLIKYGRDAHQELTNPPEYIPEEEESVAEPVALKWQLLAVFEEDEVLKECIDPVTCLPTLYPFKHPGNNNYYDLHAYLKTLENDICPYTRAPIKPEEIVVDKEKQRVMCARVIELIDATLLDETDSKAKEGFEELKAECEQILANK